MIKIAATIVLALCLCQFATARVALTSSNNVFEIAPRDAVQCAQELRETAAVVLDEMVENVRVRIARLTALRRECEAANGLTETICWHNYRMQFLFAFVDLIGAINNRVGNLQEFVLNALEVYFQCRQRTGEPMMDFESFIANELNVDTIMSLLDNNIPCTMELDDTFRGYFVEFLSTHLEAIRGLTAIRHRCEATENESAANLCWWQWRAELLRVLNNFVQDLVQRIGDFDRLALELLEQYYQCRLSGSDLKALPAPATQALSVKV